MVAGLRAVPGALTLLAAAAAGALAQPSARPEPADALPGGRGGTYLDLLRLVVPGISVSGRSYSGGRPIPLRHIQGREDGAGFAPAGLLDLAAVPVRSGGSDRMALLADFGAAEHATGFAILALFDIEREPRLLDAADVASDRRTSFRDPVRLPVSAADDLLTVQSTHFNSSQSYASAALILARNDRFELVDVIASFGDRACAYERSQDLAIERGPSAPVADVVATVTERTVLPAEDCGDVARPEPGSRTITVTYRWDAAAERYVADSDAFVRLARENAARF